MCLIDAGSDNLNNYVQLYKSRLQVITIPNSYVFRALIFLLTKMMYRYTKMMYTIAANIETRHPTATISAIILKSIFLEFARGFVCLTDDDACFEKVKYCVL